jgi:hypothetical protein
MGGPSSGWPPQLPPPDLGGPVIGSEHGQLPGGDGIGTEQGGYADLVDTEVLGIDEALIVEAEPSDVPRPVAAAIGNTALPEPESGDSLAPTFAAPDDTALAQATPVGEQEDLEPEPVETYEDALRARHRQEKVEARDPFRNLDPGIREATHPYRPAEEIDDQNLVDYYAIPESNDPAWQAWEHTERALASGNVDILDTAAELIDEALEEHAPETPAAGLEPDEAPVFDSDRDAERWYDAAVLGASLPAFADRIEHGEVQPDTAAEVYQTMVEDVLPNTLGLQDAGDTAEAVVYALGARSVALDGDASKFMHFSSPRESTNSMHNPDGQVYNHDLHQLPDGAKVAIEVKVRRGNAEKHKTHYDPGIAFVRFVNDLGPSLMAGDVNPGGTSGVNQIPRSQLGMEIARAACKLMREEVRTGVRQAALDDATGALWDRIDEQRRNRPYRDPRVFSDTLRDRQQE